MNSITIRDEIRPKHFVGYCDEHGEFHFHGPTNGYCPVVCDRWGQKMACNHMARNVELFSLNFAARGLRDAFALLRRSSSADRKETEHGI